MKKIGIAFVALLAVVGIGVYVILGDLDDYVETTIEEVGGELLGTEVSLDDVVLDLANGSATLDGLTIDNPQGYTSDHALALQRVVVAIDPTTITGPVVFLDEVLIRGARLNVEQRGNRSNLSDLLDHVRQHGTGSSGEAKEPPVSEDSGDVRLYLKRFAFVGSKATVVSDGGSKQVIKVPDVRRRNMGNAEGGLSPEQLGDQILEAILEEVEKAVASHLAQSAGNALKNKLMEKIGVQGEE